MEVSSTYVSSFLLRVGSRQKLKTRTPFFLFLSKLDPFTLPRPRPPRRLLPRLYGHLGPARLGLRDPIPVRHVPPVDHRRLPARAARLLVEFRQPLGDREAQRELPGQVLRARERSGRRGRKAGVQVERRGGCDGEK